MQRRILLLLDSLEIRKEISSYSIDLARRLEATLDVLILLCSRPKELEETEQEAEQVLDRLHAQIRGVKVEAHGMVRYGDPVSELLKYLAESRPFQAIIWGGNEQLLRSKSTPVRTHWLEQIRKKLECPLVVPSLRESQNAN